MNYDLKKKIFRVVVLSSLAIIGLGFDQTESEAAPLVSNGNAVTSLPNPTARYDTSLTYYGYTEPYATISYNSIDIAGNRILLGYGKADQNGWFKFDLSHRLRAGVYSWVYVTSNQDWANGETLNGRTISTGTSKKSDFSVYERVVDGGKYFDSNDPSNKLNRSVLGGNVTYLRNKNTTPLVDQSILPKAITISKPNEIISDQFGERTSNSYPYGNLFTYKAGIDLYQGTENGQTEPVSWSWNGLTTTGAATNGKDAKFVSKMRLIRTADTGATLEWQGTTYKMDAQQGAAMDTKGNLYVVYDNDNDAKNLGGFVMRISASFVQYLTSIEGKEQVDNKNTPLWLTTEDVKKALDSGQVALSEILPIVHGAVLTVVDDTPYVLTTNKEFTTQTLTKLSYSYALGKGPQNTGTTAKYKDTATRTLLTATDVVSGTFKKNDHQQATGVSLMPKNFTMVDNDTGYFVIPYSKSSGNQKGWYGYAVYQVKVANEQLNIRQNPIVIQNILGDTKSDGTGIDPAQSISYNPNDGRLYITANDVWMSFDLEKYNTVGTKALSKYVSGASVSYTQSTATDNANPIETQLGAIDIGLSSTKLNSKMETEQLIFFGDKTYLIANNYNQLLEAK
ncbi:hypothetical protein [Enterococcus sp. CWB-B31]|uniref:hypothetical protein n=1 Tax=Enterococcus sp. CWB-B31 TaxID=2885159 RepID=UPI001E2958F9|nr:hypothetical protein [Enterococcus sp. CWB-B31]MCB5953550.1 hypothetical protein [Enterococcus sp. CWB-B31]